MHERKNNFFENKKILEKFQVKSVADRRTGKISLSLFLAYLTAKDIFCVYIKKWKNETCVCTIYKKKQFAFIFSRTIKAIEEEEI